MATRIAVGYTVDTETGSPLVTLSDPKCGICASYVHWGGGPERMLPFLRTWYDTRDKVKALVAGGSMSSMLTRETWESRSRPLLDATASPLRDEQGFLRYENDRDPQPLYHSERGEKRCSPVTDSRPPSQWGQIMDIEHIYVMVSSTQHWNHIAID